GEVPEDPDCTIPFGVAAVRRAGARVTIATYSHGVGMCIAAADKLAADAGIDCEVIDLRTLVPLDLETVLRSVRKTHRAVVVHEEWRSVGFGAELASRIYEEAFDDLDAPIERVGGPFVPMPYSKPLERAAIPNEDDVVAAVKRVIA
ncbi:MAG TPA: transketolase C-terminal domain-containing protein, partial [Chthonomonadales bacterium]|nr:transketolase C-terminal domain-containing protein [Chthonomonadales bacterium]